MEEVVYLKRGKINPNKEHSYKSAYLHHVTILDSKGGVKS